MSILFISDLHLDASRPQITELFLEFLRGEGRQAAALYILGDFFEAWIGDDDDDPHYGLVKAGLRELAAGGVPVFFMHGNRDFLVGRRFARETGIKLLRDPTVLDLSGSRTLLMHGDTLCSDDVQYQRARAIMRNRLAQRIFLAMPLSVRRRYAARLRANSRAHTADKADYLMDVNQATVEDMMGRYGVQRLIHGHTHRPAVHHFKSGGKDMERIVLGDWYEQSSILRWSGKGGALSDTRVPDGHAD